MIQGIGDRILMRSVGGVEWNDISNAVFVNEESENDKLDLDFSDNGSAIYLLDLASGNSVINGDSLTTAWDITTHSWGDTGLLDNIESIAFDFNFDKSKIWFLEDSESVIHECSLSSPGDVTTMSYNSVFYDLGFSSFSSAIAIRFSSDGSNLYIVRRGFSTDTLYQYSLSTSFDISTRSLENTFPLPDNDFYGLDIKPDGTKIFLISQNDDIIREYTLSTSFDISTMSFVDSFDLSSYVAGTEGLRFKPDGSGFYLVSSFHVYQFSL